MKHLNKISILFFAMLLTAGCKKEIAEFKAGASVYVVNAGVGAGSVKVNAGAEARFTWAKAADLTYGNASLYGAPVGSNTVTVVSSTDTTKILFNRTIDLQAANTLYITGQAPNTDTLFRAESTIPRIDYYKTDPDFSMYVRFVNLSPNSGSVNIKLAAANEVSGLGYKDISDFKKYAASSTTPNYVFEARDAVTNDLLGSYTLSSNTNRFKTVSIVLRGLKGVTSGANAFGFFLVSYL